MRQLRGVSLSLIIFVLGCSPTIGPVTEISAPTEEVEPTPSLVAGIFPFAPAAQLDELYGPMMREMGEQLGMTVHLRTATSFEKFSANLNDGLYDIALVQPFEYPTLIDRGYRPVVRSEPNLRATLVGKDDLRPAEAGIAGLAGLRIGTPPQESAMRVLVEAALLQAGLDLSTLDIVAFLTHADCLGQLRLATVDVCAVAPQPLRAFEEATNSTLQVIAVTEQVASIAFVASPELAPDQFTLIQQFFVGLDDNPDTQPVLDRAGTTQYVLIQDGDYRRVRELLALRASE